MMRILKYCLLFLLAIILIGLLSVTVQPSEYNVTRSKIIEQPVVKAFNIVNNLKTLEKWVPGMMKILP